MNTKTAIDATIESLFKRTNEQIIVKALFYSVGMNKSADWVRKELKFKENESVHGSVKAVGNYRINKPEFNDAFLKADKDIYDFIQYKRSKNKIKELRGLANRMSFKHDVLIVKQQMAN